MNTQPKAFLIFLSLLISFFLYLSAPCFVLADSLRALNCLVSSGDSKLSVIQCFGEPVYKEVKMIMKRTVGTRYVKTPVESWFYVVDRFKYKIELIDGRVKAIESLGQKQH